MRSIHEWRQLQEAPYVLGDPNARFNAARVRRELPGQLAPMGQRAVDATVNGLLNAILTVLANEPTKATWVANFVQRLIATSTLPEDQKALLRQRIPALRTQLRSGAGRLS